MSELTELLNEAQDLPVGKPIQELLRAAKNEIERLQGELEDMEVLASLTRTMYQ